MNYTLSEGEYVLLTDSVVSFDGVIKLVANEVIITNNYIVCEHGTFQRRIQKFPINKIQVFQGKPQLFISGDSLSPSLDICFTNSVEKVRFSNILIPIKAKAHMQLWINALTTAVNTVHREAVMQPQRNNIRNMSFKAPCSKCGFLNDSRNSYCTKCGTSIDKNVGITGNTTRDVIYEGKDSLCPNCGKKVDSSTSYCTSCGFKIQDVSSSMSVKEFIEKYEELVNIEDRIHLINSFVVPNTKEDIKEFIILASLYIDHKAYKNNSISEFGVSEKDIIEAWIAKFEQAYQKANWVFSEDSYLKKIEEIYTEKKTSLLHAKEKERKRNNKLQNMPIIIYVSILIILVALFVFWGISHIIENKSENKKDAEQIKVVEELISAGEYEEALEETDFIYDFWTQQKLVIKIQRLLKQEGKAKIPYFSIEDDSYSDIEKKFKDEGFINIKLEKVPDLITGWVHKDGEIIEVLIDGSTVYESGTYISNDVEIIIKYHTFK